MNREYNKKVLQSKSLKSERNSSEETMKESRIDSPQLIERKNTRKNVQKRDKEIIARRSGGCDKERSTRGRNEEIRKGGIGIGKKEKKDGEKERGQARNRVR